ncbi:hypothetical protein OAX78_03835, partial [Planctomycetota bacterium]|nr:hypothetical protein [Planctomycetota bacterium]
MAPALSSVANTTSSQQAQANGSNANFQAAGLAAVQGQAYWYSRYNLGSLVMKSGNGKTFMPTPADVQMMIDSASDSLSQATPPQNPALLARVYDSGDPTFSFPDDGAPGDFGDQRWTSQTAGRSTTSFDSVGWTLIKELQWARQFHVDSHFGAPATPNTDAIPGAQQRFSGLALLALAMNQVAHFNANPGGYRQTTTGSYVLLWALSDLKALLATQALPHSSGNRYRAAAAAMNPGLTADQVADSIRVQADQVFASLPTPQTVQERSIAVQALAWYAFACEENHELAITRLGVVADALARMQASTATERAYQIRGLVESYRIRRQEQHLQQASGLFQELLADYDMNTQSLVSQSTYSADDVAAILGALNALRIHGGSAVDQSQLTVLLVNLFEGLVNRSGLQLSAPPMQALPTYEQARWGSELMFRYPSVPTPRVAGDAPVFAAEVSRTPQGWTQTREFDTAGAMHLANELMWFHEAEVNGFPSRVPDLLISHPEFRAAGMSAVQREAYWYSRYNLGHLAMRSGNGDPLRPASSVIQRVISETSDTLSQSRGNPTAFLTRRPYDLADPSFGQRNNGDASDFANHRWTATSGARGRVSSQEALGWTLLKEIEWARQFHVDGHFGVPARPNTDGIPGAQQRFAGGVLFVEAFRQYETYRHTPGLFDNDLAGRYVMLAALADLGQLIATPQLEHSQSNRYRTIALEMTGRPADQVAAEVLTFADRVFQDLLREQPRTIKELSLAIQAMAWYRWGTTRNKDAASSAARALANRLTLQVFSGASDRAFGIRGLIEAYRLTGDDAFRQSAALLFGAMVSDYDGFNGVFRSQTRYSTQSVAAILGALNALRLHGGDAVSQDWVRRVILGFFEAAVNQSGLQIAAPPSASIPQYERDRVGGAEINFSYPSMPTPGQVPGTRRNGTAPVFAALVAFDPATRRWSARQDRFHTASAMHLANE